MIHKTAQDARTASYELRDYTAEDRRRVLCALAQRLESCTDSILVRNHEDLTQAEKDGLSAPLLDRLRLDRAKLAALIEGLYGLAEQNDPLETAAWIRELDNGLELHRIICPIGVIGVVFEARPDALVQVAGLGIKTGNAVILKGGSEALRSNRRLTEIIREVLADEGFPVAAVQTIESRADLRSILDLHEYVDLLIPRGSNDFVRYCMENTLIPVMGHADGVCHIYLHAEADLAEALPIITDAKTQAPATCNAVETLLIDAAWQEELNRIFSRLQDAGIRLYGDRELAAEYGFPLAEDPHHEYLDCCLSVFRVEGLRAAVRHINRYGSGHTDAILTRNQEVAALFMKRVDSANVYHNCSTRFADGYRYGFGAEVGVSTSKIHARGPVGPEGLLSYQYRIFGSGQRVVEYIDGTRRFTHRDLSSPGK